MQVGEAVMAFSQSEKIKAGLIWVSHGLQGLRSLSEEEKQGVVRSLRMILNMVAQELQLARKIGGDAPWEETQKHLEKALVMMNSGVAEEAVFHITKALSEITSIGQRSMTALKDKGLL
jgi:hypothetical protein